MLRYILQQAFGLIMTFSLYSIVIVVPLPNVLAMKNTLVLANFGLASSWTLAISYEILFIVLAHLFVIARKKMMTSDKFQWHYSWAITLFIFQLFSFGGTIALIEFGEISPSLLAFATLFNTGVMAIVVAIGHGLGVFEEAVTKLEMYGKPKQIPIAKNNQPAPNVSKPTKSNVASGATGEATGEATSGAIAPNVRQKEADLRQQIGAIPNFEAMSATEILAALGMKTHSRNREKVRQAKLLLLEEQ